jgi:hypothetical protein
MRRSAHKGTIWRAVPYAALGLLLGVVSFTGMVAADPIMGNEPGADSLGAPRYPGAVFIRIMPTLDPYHFSVLYVTSDPVRDVRRYFGGELPSANMVQYVDENDWAWVFLLDDTIAFPEEPTRDDLTLLDGCTNVRIKEYQPELYVSLQEYFQRSEGNEDRFEALDSAATIIRYTFLKVFEDTTSENLLGIWRNVDRSFPEFYGSMLTFRDDGTYAYELTGGNIEAIARDQRSVPMLAMQGVTVADSVRARLTDRNPETGLYMAALRTLVIKPERPFWSDDSSSGIVEASRATLTLQFINMPRLTFIRED